MFAKLKPSGGGLGLGTLSGPSNTSSTPSNSSQNYVVNNMISNTNNNFSCSGGSATGFLEQNPIVQHFDIGRQTGSAGPELVWRIFYATRRSDGKVSSSLFPHSVMFIFFFRPIFTGLLFIKLTFPWEVIVFFLYLLLGVFCFFFVCTEIRDQIFPSFFFLVCFVLLQKCFVVSILGFYGNRLRKSLEMCQI